MGKRLVRDVEGSKKANIKVLAVTWGFDSEENLKASIPDYLVRTPKDAEKTILNHFGV